MRRVRNQKGFTIMELMIVIVIIGILIAIAVPAYQNFRARAQSTACKANMRTIESAAGLYFADQGVWPAAPADLWTATPADAAVPNQKYLDAAILEPTTKDVSYTIALGKVTCTAVAAHNN